MNGIDTVARLEEFPQAVALVSELASRVHIVLGAGTGQKAGRAFVPESAGAEMGAHPDRTVLVFENIDIVVPAADRTLLRPGARIPSVVAANGLIIVESQPQRERILRH